MKRYCFWCIIIKTERNTKSRGDLLREKQFRQIRTRIYSRRYDFRYIYYNVIVIFTLSTVIYIEYEI